MGQDFLGGGTGPPVAIVATIARGSRRRLVGFGDSSVGWASYCRSASSVRSFIAPR